MLVAEEEQLSLTYYLRQHCSRQWVHFLAAMVAEFENRVDAAEADQFLEVLGVRMARMMPLRQCESLEELEDDINAILEDIDWGWAQLSEGDHFIEIAHGAYPVVPQTEGRRSWIAPVLEGLYSEWLGAQSGDRSFVARLAEPAEFLGAPISFRYGYHG
jgi:hypothetical protein